MITLYDYEDSGNGYKVRLALAQLAIPYRLVPIDILRGESRTPDFLQKNPNGRVPILELEDGSFLPESNAILYYLAHGSHLVPSDRLAHARTLSWMFFEQYSHEPFLATARYILRHCAGSERMGELSFRIPKAREALAVLERQLERTPFLVGESYSIADICLYAYTHRAPEAEVDLSPYPAINGWIARVQSTPGYLPMLPDRPSPTGP